MTPHEKQKNLSNYIETAIVGVGILVVMGVSVMSVIIKLIKIIIK